MHSDEGPFFGASLRDNFKGPADVWLNHFADAKAAYFLSSPDVQGSWTLGCDAR